jgi:hypothetical protein
MTMVVFVAAALVLAVCALLVLHRDYHAGFVGNLGLGMLALAAATRLAGILEQGGEVRITPLGVLLWIGLALFLGRHAFKFLHRWRAGGPTWYACRRAEAPRRSPASAARRGRHPPGAVNRRSRR